MSGYVIIVDFRLKPGTQADFRRLIDDTARISATTEAGCRRFDVVEPWGERDRVLLYEIYEDRAAFEAHVQSPHFAHFDAESMPLIAGKSVVECDLVCEGAAQPAA